MKDDKGRTVHGELYYEGRSIAMVFQEPMSALDPVYTIGQQITESIRAHEAIDRKSAAARALAMLDNFTYPSTDQGLDQQ